jgi:hypothetical protein
MLVIIFISSIALIATGKNYLFRINSTALNKSLVWVGLFGLGFVFGIQIYDHLADVVTGFNDGRALK